MTTDPSAGDVFDTMVGAVLGAEYERRKTLDGRGAILVATSASMLTLVLGLTVIVTGKELVLHSSTAVAFLILALVLFVVAAMTATVVQTYGFRYSVPDRGLLRALTADENWARTADDARRMWVSRQVDTIVTLRQGNDIRANLLSFGLMVQMVAVVMLGAAVVIELHARLRGMA